MHIYIHMPICVYSFRTQQKDAMAVSMPFGGDQGKYYNIQYYTRLD